MGNTELSSLDFMVILPELFMLAMVMLILLVEVFTKKSNQAVIYSLSLITLIGAGLLSIFQYNLGLGDVASAFTVSSNTMDQSVNFWNGEVAHSKTISFIKLAMLFVVLIGLIYSYPRLKDENIAKTEFYILILLSTLGMLILVSAGSLLTLYLGLELMSLPMYGLVALNRQSRKGTEAAMKYFVMGAMASGILLFGIALIYGATGTFKLDEIMNRLIDIAQGDIEGFGAKLLLFASAFIVAGTVFKVGAAPFHAWVPDVYEGSPLPVAMYVGSAPKIAALVMGALLLLKGLYNISDGWQTMLAIVAIASFILGNLVALKQDKIRRLLGYSAVSHGGFIILGLFVDGAGFTSGLFYAITYALTTVAAFGFLLALKNRGNAIVYIDELKGFARNNPWYATLMGGVMLSMAGIPFLVGFQAKLVVLVSAFHAGYTYTVIVGLIMSVIGLFYYLRVIKVMFFDEKVEENDVKIVSSTGNNILLSANILSLAFLGAYPAAILYFIS